ncbi:Conserved TM helix repeat-containing protein [Methanohalobium evestigatum Z-7303]|uniref:Conserved TM helix repeat-containing protein n=1 Tax=Methanohalobium evestigatum (strain ATCC BAA-1072 / DSM 3721 / NBRC 107634 / OCM 161 / Z-7303) TaxID=644295 RepID=D7E913_METEZ|nr:hypothetical protein [Methanohalobium evestigatum]ADI73961.1 Conserved TM helix repeat-containing protein [Methanohalobium evestigatum Z-7303]
MVNTPIMDSLYNMVSQMIEFIPLLVAIIVLLIVGRFVGKGLGKLGSRILEKIGLDILLDKTAIGKMISKSNITTTGFFDTIIRWFVYLVFAVIIIDLLQIQIVSDFLTDVIAFIPLIASAAIILVVGFLVVDFLADLVKKVLETTELNDKVAESPIGNAIKASGTSVSGIISGLIKLFGYLLFVTAALNVLQLSIIADLVGRIVEYLPNLAAGILILIGGLLAIGVFEKYLDNFMKGMSIESANVLLPMLRGVLLLLVIFIALDTMLVNIGVFYVILQPLAWGVAVIIAFKYGIKDAIVAYAKERKQEG